MSSNQETSKIEAIGCLGIIGLIVFVALIPVIIEFIKFLMFVSVFAGIGYLIFKIVNDPIWIDRIERWLNLNSGTRKSQDEGKISEYEIAALQSPKIEELSEELTQVKGQILNLSTENQRMKDREEEVIKETLDTFGKQVAKREGERFLNNLFGETPSQGYDRSTEHEKQEYLERRKAEEDELTLRKIELDMGQKFYDLKQDVTERTQQTQQEVFALKQVVMEGFTAIAREFLGVHQEITSIKGYVTEKFAQMETMIVKEISSVKELVLNLEQRIYREIGDVKLQFGHEVLRLDQQQLKMLGKLQEFNNTIGSFHNDMRRLRMDAERFEMRGQDMLNKTITIQQRHEVAMKKQSLELSDGLQKMALHDQEFANQVGSAKLMLEQRSGAINLALKDMAYERIGINALRDDYQSRDNLAQERLARKEQEVRHIQQNIQREMQYNRDTSQLNHQLNMASQQKTHLSNMASLVQRESSLIRRLSK